MRRCVPIVVLLLALMSTAMAVGERTPASPWEPDATWRHVYLSDAVASLSIRTVREDEPWEQVVRDVQDHLGATRSGRPARVGFYGHGAFVKRAEVQHDMPFVAALGVAAKMDVMVFPYWRFPEQHPLADIPQQVLQAQLNNLFKNPGETVIETLRRKARQVALENRYATAHAAVRLAEGISAFHTRHMTPSLAAFSNSALVVVRLGQLLERGWISDGYKDIAMAESVRQELSLNNIVTFGYPLPNGRVSAALRQRVSGTLVNVVPADCWKQLGGNFLLNGGKNVPVPWAPSHADWPRLSPQGPEVAVLGTLLGNGAEPSLHLPPRSGQRVPGGPPVVQWLWDTLCEQVQRLDPAVVFNSP
jgi:hypothetical protein